LTEPIAGTRPCRETPAGDEEFERDLLADHRHVEATRRGRIPVRSAPSVSTTGRLNIVTRTLVRHDDAYCLRVGAGVVHDSDPDAEYEEIHRRAARW
jgi:anthranilate/para-aminobenzoate synthase component I